jgi:hypothetical protein
MNAKDTCVPYQEDLFREETSCVTLLGAVPFHRDIYIRGAVQCDETSSRTQLSQTADTCSTPVAT